MVDLDEIIKSHLDGDLEKAIKGYSNNLAGPNPSAIAANNLGVIAQKFERYGESIDLFSKAISLKKDYEEAFFNRANSLVRLERFADAERDFKTAISFKPNYVKALRNYGVMLARQKHYQHAFEVLYQGVTLNPLDAGLLENLLYVCFSDKKIEQGILIIKELGGEKVLTNFDLKLLWVSLLAEQDQLREALSFLDQFEPSSDVESCRYLCVKAKLQNNAEARLELFLKALTHDQNSIDCLVNIGVSYLELNRLDQAKKHLLSAINIDASNPQALMNLGVLYRRLGRVSDATDLFQAALSFESNYEPALRNLGLISLGEGDPTLACKAFNELVSRGLLDNGNLGFLLLAKQSIADWFECDHLKRQVCDLLKMNRDVIDPFSLLALVDDPELQKIAAVRLCLASYPPSPSPLWTGEEYSHDRIRIGYLSADYHEHATSYLMAELFESHDKSQFETYAISFGKHSDGAMRQRLVKAFDHFIDVNDKTDREVAEMMRELEIDIAIDLKGYTADARPGILSHRPCPVQAQYLGFPGTMGASYIDYIIADDVIIPESHEQYYTEKVIRLPGCYQPHDSTQKIADRIPTRAEEGLPEGAYVYCCFNNNYKITPEIFDVWMEILRDVPDSVLWLYEGNAAAPTNLRKEAEKRGVDPDRLIFAKKKPIEEHLARHKLADLFLDTVPCNAHTTARDALIAGLPVLTLMGDTFASRVAASLGQRTNGILVSNSLSQYVKIATEKPNINIVWRNSLDNFNSKFYEIISQLIQPNAFNSEGAIENPELLLNSKFNPDVTMREAVSDLERGNTQRGRFLLRKILDVEPKNIIAKANLALTYALENQFLKASRLYSELCTQDPYTLQHIYQLAFCHEQLSNFREASELYRELLEKDPRHIKALNNLALLLSKDQRYDEALMLIEKGFAHHPDNSMIVGNFLGVLNEAKSFDRAVESGSKLIQKFPDDVNIINNYGNALIQKKLYREATILLDSALSRGIERIDLWYHSGIALRGSLDFEEAAKRFKRTLVDDPKYDLSLGYLLDALRQCCDWSQVSEVQRTICERSETGFVVIDPFTMMAVSGDPVRERKVAELYAEKFYPPSPSPLWTGEEYSHDRIRIGYLSADYHEHATSYLMAELFESHDKSQFETYAISFGKHSDGAMRQRLVKAFDHFIDVNDKTDREVAEMMRELEIDIAIDLKGYTADARPGILSHRPCPVQAQYLGFPGTMGASYIDYIIADDVIIPESHEQYYTEKVIRLPGCYQPHDSTQKIADRIPTRAEEGLPEGAYVYCCFNNNYKITPEIFDVWMEILRDVPDSVLWLYEGNAAAPTNLRKEAEKRGVDPDRLIFAKKKPIEEHLARHKLADLFLDTVPCNAHTTARDALIAGLPVLTLMGDTFASRVAASIGQTVQSGLLVATDFNEYREIAIKRSPASVGFKTYDPAGYTRDLESVYSRLMA